MLKNRLLYLLGVLAAFVFHIFYFGWYSWYLLVLVLCLPWFVLFVSLPAMLQVRLKLTLPEQCTAGDTAFLRVATITGRRTLPHCQINLTVKRTLDGKTTVYRQGWRRKERIALDTRCAGILQCSAKGSRVCDYLGLFALPVRGSYTRELLVLPRPLPPDPLPDLAVFAAGRRRPKPGGGFSEEHELREYRAGDPLRDIHWKLSAKTDRMILREAQEPVRERILLTFDLPETVDGMNQVLSRLMWLSQWLTRHEAHHEICWLDPLSNRMETAIIRENEDLTTFYGKFSVVRCQNKRCFWLIHTGRAPTGTIMCRLRRCSREANESCKHFCLYHGRFIVSTGKQRCCYVLCGIFSAGLRTGNCSECLRCSIVDCVS